MGYVEKVQENIEFTHECEIAQETHIVLNNPYVQNPTEKCAKGKKISRARMRTSCVKNKKDLTMKTQT